MRSTQGRGQEKWVEIDVNRQNWTTEQSSWQKSWKIAERQMVQCSTGEIYQQKKRVGGWVTWAGAISLRLWRFAVAVEIKIIQGPVLLLSLTFLGSCCHVTAADLLVLLCHNRHKRQSLVRIRIWILQRRRRWHCSGNTNLQASNGNSFAMTTSIWTNSSCILR